ncbi:MAG: ABC transporter substrate-binding protein [Actinomycetota bacterium]
MISRTRRILVALTSALAVVAGSLIGVQAAQAAPSATCNLKSKPSNAQCDVIIYGALHRIQSLDPINPVGGYTEGQMAYTIQGKLYRFDNDGKPRRDLVASATISADRKTITHTLRDAKYSDGTPIVAADAVNAFDRWINSKRSASYIDAVEKVVAKDSKTLVWTLKRPYPDFNFALATEFFGIHPASKTDTAAKATEYFKNPVAGGPMMPKTFVPGTDLFVSVANPNYWAKPVVKEIQVRTIPDGNTRLAAFQAGDVDYAMELPLSAAKTKWDKTKYRVVGEKDSGVFMLAFNMGALQPNAALKDARVRQAISLAVDRGGIMRTAFAGLSKPSCGMQFEFKNDYYLCSLPKDGKRDSGAARKLLKDAGYPNGFKVTMLVPNRIFWQDAAQLVKDSLKYVGIDVTISMVTPDTNISNFINKRDWEMMWFGNNAATGILQLSNWFKPGGVWAGNANIPDALLTETAKLLNEAASSESPAVIREKLAGVEKIAYEQSIFIPIGTRFYLSGSRIAPGLVNALLPGQLQFIVATNPALPLD